MLYMNLKMNLDMTGGRGGRWSTPDVSWLDMEAAADRETFFMNVALG
jgi:hypothetical protein